MPTTRRMNGMATDPPSSPPKSIRRTSSNRADPSLATIPPPTHSAYLPTRTEALLLFLYPLTLVLGSLFSHFSPSLRPPTNASIYSDVHQSFQPASAAPSYFAQKRNVFNVYFVKIGWFWCTLAFTAFALFVARGRGVPAIEDALAAPQSPNTAPGRRSGTRSAAEKDALQRRAAEERLRRRWQAAMRYAAATLFWIVTTQWFFGPGLVDRGFAFTGGVCEIASEKLLELERSGAVDAATLKKEEIARVVTHAACKVAGGTWKGGYDISGHVFILVLGSGMLWLEMLPFLLPRVKGLGLGRIVRTDDGVECRVVQELIRSGQDALIGTLDGTGDTKEKDDKAWGIKEYATTLALAVAVLSWWMLLMTAAFFHTWFEKLTGCIWAFFCLWVVYFSPRGQPTLRSILGMPGI